MKYVFLFLLSIGFTAHADCLNFQEGYQPSQMGNVMFLKKASAVCFESGNDTQAIVTFKDEAGLTLASFISSITEHGKCETLCQTVEVTNGFAYNSDINPAGTKIKIETSRKPELGVTIGVLAIQAGKGFPVKAIVIGK